MAREIIEKTCPICRATHTRNRRKTCRRSCQDKLKQRTAKAKADGKHYNDFLPPDAEENEYGFWVPSPEEIEHQKQLLRAGLLTAKRA